MFILLNIQEPVIINECCLYISNVPNEMPKTIIILIQPSSSLLSCQGCLNLIPYPVLVRGEGGAIWASTGGVSSSTGLSACLLPTTKDTWEFWSLNSWKNWDVSIGVANHIAFQCHFIHRVEYFTYPDPGVKVVPLGQVQLLGFTPAPHGLFSEFRILSRIRSRKAEIRLLRVV